MEERGLGCRLFDMEMLVVSFVLQITFSCLVRPVDNPCFRGGGYVMIATSVSIRWRRSSFLASLRFLSGVHLFHFDDSSEISHISTALFFSNSIIIM